MKKFWSAILNFGLIISLNAQVAELTPEIIDSQYDALQENTPPAELITNLKKITAQAKAINYHKGEAKANMALGNTYFEIGKLDEALKHYQNSLQLSEKMNDTAFIAESNISLSYIKHGSGENEDALNFASKGVDLANHINNELLIARGMSTKGIIYASQKEFDKAIAEMEAAKAIMEKLGDIDWVKNSIYNIAYIYVDKGEFSSVLPHAFEYLDYSKENDSKVQQAFGHQLIGKAYLGLNEFSKALSHIDSALVFAKNQDLKSLIFGIFEDKAKVYQATGDLKSAITFYKKFQLSKEEYLDEVTQKNIAELNIQYETEKQKKELLVSQNEVANLEINQQRLWILVGGLIAGLVVATLIYLQLRNRAKKKAIEQKLIQSELKNKELEAAQLQTKLKSKQSDLTNLALDIARKNEFSNQLIDKLESLQKIKQSELKPQLREVLSFAVNHLQINEDLSLLQKNVDTVNQEFYQKLETKFGSLTPNEKYLAGLLRLNLSNKDVAAIRSISVSSAKMSRHRLRQKLKLDATIDVVKFLQKV